MSGASTSAKAAIFIFGETQACDESSIARLLNLIMIANAKRSHAVPLPNSRRSFIEFRFDRRRRFVHARSVRRRTDSPWRTRCGRGLGRDARRFCERTKYAHALEAGAERSDVSKSSLGLSERHDR